jgi:glutathione S-transferase
MKSADGANFPSHHFKNGVNHMYKLYNVKAWGSLAIHFLLEEMAVPYTNIWMTPEQVAAPEFKSISPLGYIPALGLDDGTILFESAAIVSFLVTTHNDKAMAPAVGTPEFGEFLSWLHFMSTNIYSTINLSEHGAGDARAIEKTHELWAILEKRLQAEGPWMMGATYSALDAYAFMLTLWSKPGERALLAKFPAVAELVRAVRARPSLKAALEAHGVMEPRS